MTDFNDKKIPEILKNLRKEAGYTQKQLADKVGISRETVSAIENGHVNILKGLREEALSKWWLVCKHKSKQETKERFYKYILARFKFASDFVEYIKQNL